MHLGIKSKTPVLQALDQMALPEGALPIQSVAMLCGHPRQQLPHPSRTRQGFMTEVMLKIQRLVFFPIITTVTRDQSLVKRSGYLRVLA